MKKAVILEDDYPRGGLTGHKTTVGIGHTALQKIRFAVECCEFTEVSGFGTVTKRCRPGANCIEYTINDIFIPKQEVSMTTTEFDSEACSDTMHEAAESGAKGGIMFWWHSHVDMQVIWSTRDKQTMWELCGEGGVMIAGVYNRRKESRYAILERRADGFHDFRDDITVNPLYPGLSAKQEGKIKQLIDDRVDHVVPQTVLAPGFRGYKHYHQYHRRIHEDPYVAPTLPQQPTTSDKEELPSPCGWQGDM